MMMIGSSVDYVRSGGMRNVPFTKTVEHLYATTAKFSGSVLLASCPAYSYPPRRRIPLPRSFAIASHHVNPSTISHHFGHLFPPYSIPQCTMQLKSVPSLTRLPVSASFMARRSKWSSRMSKVG
ncbi:hypothetical protein AVEN_76857-1 [Araneus ventricosus]|uniref:Uncharacterized protein n=1 Tax=Araneus ventricosus TaxID=182803 RepID=A0A4Y2KWP7_ARAVE|nr:hypothetical protein AVEN_76857-1 [Araneus ventricosus]